MNSFFKFLFKLFSDKKEEQKPVAIERISDNGLDLIKHFESLHLNAYVCPAGYLTIGWGHTGITHNDGTVFMGRKITEQEADDLLKYDMKYFEEVVKSLVNAPLSQNQFDALVSFAFNCGEGNLRSSTLLKKINSLDYQGASDEFLKWNKARVKGKLTPLNGLTRRRASEKRLFDGLEDPIVASVSELKELGYQVV